MPRLSLRARLTLVATAALAAGLAAGAALLLFVTHRSGLSTVDDGAARAGREIAELYRAGKLPTPIPVTGSASAYVQIVEDGRVVAASATADRLVPLLRDAETGQVRRGDRLNLAGDRAGMDTPIRVVGVPADDATVRCGRWRRCAAAPPRSPAATWTSGCRSRRPAMRSTGWPRR